jgi:hypothetical protein
MGKAQTFPVTIPLSLEKVDRGRGNKSIYILSFRILTNY